MKEPLNILFSCDTNYVMPVSVSITSIFENNKEENITIYVFHSNATNEQCTLLEELAKKYGQTIHMLKIDEHYFSSVPTLRWSKETYYRLLICDLLPESVTRILYLDCDIIVNKSIHELYSLNIVNYCIAALKENVDHQQFRKRLKLNPSGYYFQAGVILFDLHKIRGILDYTKAIETIKRIGNDLIAVDQDVINVLFDGKIFPIEKKYNDAEITTFNKNNLHRFLNYTNSNNIEAVTIFHYATGKPWNNLYSGSCEKIWYKYLLLSPYKSLYDSKFNTLTYKILRTGIFKTLFFTYIHITPVINNLGLKLLPKEAYNYLKGFYRRKIK